MITNNYNKKIVNLSIILNQVFVKYLNYIYSKYHSKKNNSKRVYIF